MKTLVILPMGAHPFHAGHMALYNSAKAAFPDSDVYIAATNDTSTRPFPFAVKQKLAKLSGVPENRFIPVKSPFRADEITRNYNPADTQLIFVRSEKDATKPPQPGGVKRDGTPSYLQPISDQMAPMTQHAYMAYLPTVEFGPGMTSATQIRTAWPSLNERQRTALVMSLYPNTQSNPKLANTVVKMLNTAIGTEVAEGLNDEEFTSAPYVFSSIKHAEREAAIKGKKVVRSAGGYFKLADIDDPAPELIANPERDRLVAVLQNRANALKDFLKRIKIKRGTPVYDKFIERGGYGTVNKKITAINSELAQIPKFIQKNIASGSQQGVDEEVTRQMSQGGMTASYQSKYNQPIAEDYLDEARS